MIVSSGEPHTNDVSVALPQKVKRADEHVVAHQGPSRLYILLGYQLIPAHWPV
jgi:hypothetical protein